MIRTALILLIAALSLVAGVAVRNWWFEETTVPLPEPRLVDLAGRAHTLSEWQGKILILNFWATWCPPCREEMPDFDRLQRELGSDGVQFVGVALDDAGAVRSFLEQHPVNYPILIGDDRTPAWSDSLGNTHAVLPFSVLFDQNGQISHTQIGLFHPAEIRSRIQPLINENRRGEAGFRPAE
jgi:thiol-disulfide isomerase/thioredoxin